jgi:hypothetical protein
VLVYPVLKVVDDAGVAEHFYRALPAAEREALELSSGEELPEVRQTQKLHAHRMDL